MGGQTTLRVHGSVDRVGGLAEDRKERIALSSDGYSVGLIDCRPQDQVVILQHSLVALTDLLKQVGRSHDVGEEECDRTNREIRHLAQFSVYSHLDFAS